MSSPKGTRKKKAIDYKELEYSIEYLEDFSSDEEFQTEGTKLEKYYYDLSLGNAATALEIPRNNQRKTSKTVTSQDVKIKDSKVVLTKNYLSESLQNLNISTQGLRRGARLKKKPKTLDGDYEVTVTPSRRKTKQLIVDDDDTPSDDEEINASEHQQKPSSLFTSEDVEGVKMFQFQSLHRKDDLHKKANSSVYNTPNRTDTNNMLKTPRLKHLKKCTPNARTPQLSKLHNVADTPKQVKDLIRKRIHKQMESDSSEAESSVSRSSNEYHPESNTSSDHESESDASSSDSEEPALTKLPRKAATITAKPALTRKTVGKLGKSSDYIIKSDSYFMMHGNKAATTSDHTLERLKNLQLHEEKLLDLNETEHVSKEHLVPMKEMKAYYRSLFDKWFHILSEGYNILLYGVGSKRNILLDFRKKINEGYGLAVNGYFPGLTVKSIIESILNDLLESKHQIPANPFDALSLIDEELNGEGRDLFLIIYNIDGGMLRNNKSQTFLSQLAKIKHVRLIATIDHINAPLIWDHTKLSCFNFTWWDVTTLVPYTEETAFENSLMTQKSGALAMSALRSVYQSLTTNAKGIYKIIIEHQLKNQKTTHYQGLPFKDLYSLAREAFLVSSDIALRAQLTEFLDHKLVKSKRSVEGGENLIIPIDNTLLQQFLEQNSQ